MDLHLGQLALVDLCDDVERAFRPLAEEKGLRFAIDRDPALPAAIVTDEQRLEQMLRNLLSNALKFTHERRRSDAARSAPARAGRADGVLAFAVTDTGIGIPRREARADLRGLPAGRRHDVAQVRRHRPRPVISREIARLLGGEIRVVEHSPARAARSRCSCRSSPRAAEAHPEVAEPAEPPRRPTASARRRAPAEPCPRSTPRTTTATRSSPATASCSSSPTTPSARARPSRRRARARASRRSSRGARRWASCSPASTAPTRVLVVRRRRPRRGAARPAQAAPRDAPPPGVRGRPAGRAARRPARRARRRTSRPTDGADGRRPARSTRSARCAARPVKRLALVRNGSELDPATMALLGAGDDVDVVEVPEADALQRAARRRRRLRGARRSATHTDRVFALLEQAAGDERLRELPLVVYTPHAARPGRARRASRSSPGT